MKEERLLNILGEVDDKFIEKSAPKNLSEKNDNSLSEQQYPVVVYSENKSEKQKSHSPLIKIIGVALACAAVLGICFGVKLLGGGGLKFDLLNPADKGVFDKNNPETWFDDIKNGGVRYEDAKKIKTGMTFEEIVGILGKPQRDVGSGVVAMEWDISTGEVLYVCFNKVPPTDELNLMSYYVEIKKSTA